ncbi:hypothetical protein ABZ883_29145 [Streptomyces sp. NPDC046977]|uniref:hypothetical protein n=1 Tax=Streptomyces sp. NPDC046977 TaxID=3154703 RepID=UPI0033FBC22E
MSATPPPSARSPISAAFRPTRRGRPSPTSSPGARTCPDASWITWAELKAADWEEIANEVDDCVHEYRRSPDGTWVMHGQNSGLTRFAELSGHTDHHTLHHAGRVYAEGTEWPDGDRLFRIGRLRRKDAVPHRDWAPVWSVMRTLANLHGDEGVRLVVWFDG